MIGAVPSMDFVIEMADDGIVPASPTHIERYSYVIHKLAPYGSGHTDVRSQPVRRVTSGDQAVVQSAPAALLTHPSRVTTTSLSGTTTTSLLGPRRGRDTPSSDHDHLPLSDHDHFPPRATTTSRPLTTTTSLTRTANSFSGSGTTWTLSARLATTSCRGPMPDYSLLLLHYGPGVP